MALMEYCVVNIVLGDSEPPKPPGPPKKPSATNNIFESAAKENSMLLSIAAKIPTPPTPAQVRMMRAIKIDKFSRVFFPLLFTILNCTYWILFAEYI